MNERTISELMEKLGQCDELTILELLDITSEELVPLLVDQIEERYEILLEYFDESDSGED